MFSLERLLVVYWNNNFLVWKISLTLGRPSVKYSFFLLSSRLSYQEMQINGFKNVENRFTSIKKSIPIKTMGLKIRIFDSKSLRQIFCFSTTLAFWLNIP
jgi:hypothetical protein